MAVVGYQRPSWPEMMFRDAQGQVCTCDACDETAEPLADDLEATVFAVVAGQLRQRVERRGPVIEIGGGGRESSSWSLLQRSERRRIRRLLRDTPDRWDPWPRRT